MAKVTMSFRADDLKNKLEAMRSQLTDRKDTGITRRAMYAAGAVIRKRAQDLAPKRTGALKKAIVYRDNQRKIGKSDSPDPALFDSKVTVSGSGFAYGVTPRGRTTLRKVKKGQRAQIKPRKYAHLVEFGTAAHSVRKGSRKGSVPPKAKPHPGGQPRPFMRPALVGEAEKAVAAFKDKVLEELEKIASRRK